MGYKTILFFILTLLMHSSAHSQTWVKEKYKDGITVYTKSNAKYRMKASRVEMHVSAPVEKVVEAIYNVSNYPIWMPDCANAKVLKKINNNEIIYYALYLTPWPAASRDMVLYIKKIPLSDGVKIEMSNKSNFIEVKNDAVRIPIYFGEWHITKTDRGTKVFLEFQTDPGGSVPDWMIQGAATKTPFEMFLALKNYVS